MTRGIPDPGGVSGTFAALERTRPVECSGEPQMFTYADVHHVRVIRDLEGAPLMVLADLCRALEIRNARDVAARLGDDQKGVAAIDTPGGPQNMTVVNESGLYEVIIRSDKPEAVKFRRWITGEVLPKIRRTGSYSRYPAVPQHLPSKKELAQWVVEAEERAELAESKVRELAVPASAWNELADAAGDYSVADAAKVLARAGIKTGQQRLFQALLGHRWVFRRDGRWRAYQDQVDLGRLAEKVGKPYVRDGVMHNGDPTVRITPKGLAELRRLLGADDGGQLALVVAE